MSRAELERDVRALCAKGPRNTWAPGAMRAAAAFIEATLVDSGLRVERQTYDDGENLIAEITGGDEIVVIGAHYDSVRGCPGANDNASGVAVLVALAEVMRQQAPAIGVDLLFTDGDDFTDGRLLGTEHYLASLGAIGRPAFAVVLESVGDRDAWFPQDAGSRRHAPAVVHRVWGTAAAIGRDSVFSHEAVEDSAGAHLRFNAAGIPTALVRDPVYGPGNSYWHTVNDLPSNTSRETLAQVGEVLAEMIYRGLPQEEGGR